MTIEEAKLVLGACRPSGQDCQHPQVAEALELARTEPELARWWEEQRAFDQAVCSSVRECPVSRGLKARILAGQSVVRPAFRWGPAWWLAAAAAVVVLIGLGVALQNRTNPAIARSGGGDFENFRTDMVAFLDRLNRLDYQSREMVEVKNWLGQNGAADLSKLPAAIEESVPIGCRIVDWNGQKVTLVCFRSERDGTRYKFHLLVAQRSETLQLPAGAGTIVANQSGWSTATWADEQNIYLLATASSEELIRRFIPAPSSG